MFGAYHNVLPNDLQVICKVYIIILIYRTRQFMRETVHTNIRAMSIPVLGGKLWNSNTSLVSITSKYIFKHHYVHIVLSKYIT